MEIYHVLNRGVEKRNVVLDEGDRVRFVSSLYTFNDRKPAENAITQKRSRFFTTKPRDTLVQIYAWCLMKNHYHLLLSPVNDDTKNLSLFMKKLNMGYAKFFNDKYDRSGYLWQGKYKRIQIKRDSHFQYLPYYIHLNPLDYSHPTWRDGKVTDTQAAINTLMKYKWSSLLDYYGKRNFPSVICPDLLNSILGDTESQTRIIKRIITDDTLGSESSVFET